LMSSVLKAFFKNAYEKWTENLLMKCCDLQKISVLLVLIYNFNKYAILFKI
jgi:hypothetical protein